MRAIVISLFFVGLGCAVPGAGRRSHAYLERATSIAEENARVPVDYGDGFVIRSADGGKGIMSFPIEQSLGVTPEILQQAIDFAQEALVAIDV